MKKIFVSNLEAEDSWIAMYNRRFRIKRSLDIVIASICIVLMFPLMLVTSVLILFFLGSPVVFRQRRVGYRGEPFIIFKFRTMLQCCDHNEIQITDDQRLTSLGRLMRNWSIDELPQLFNVLKGDLSIVGPRPHLWEYRNLFTPEQWKRHRVLPGITGWAQVNGRNSIPWVKKLELDNRYIENWSLWLDLRIILITPWKILKQEGIAQPGYVTVEPFVGDIVQETPAFVHPIDFHASSLREPDVDERAVLENARSA